MTVKELREWLADKPDDMLVFAQHEGEEEPVDPRLSSELYPQQTSTETWNAAAWNKYAARMSVPERIVL